MCLFRTFFQSTQVSPESRELNRIKEDYDKLIALIYEYDIFIDTSFAFDKHSMYICRSEYNTKSQYMAHIQALFQRIELAHMNGNRNIDKYYTKILNKYKPLFDTINNRFITRLLEANMSKNLYIDKSLLYTSSLMDMIHDSGKPIIRKDPIVIYTDEQT